MLATIQKSSHHCVLIHTCFGTMTAQVKKAFLERHMLRHNKQMSKTGSHLQCIHINIACRPLRSSLWFTLHPFFITVTTMQTGRHEHQRQQSQLVFLDPLQHLWCKVGDQDVHTCVTDTQNTMHIQEQHRHECMMAAWCTDLKTWSPTVPYKLSSLLVCKVFKSFIISMFGFDWLMKSYLRTGGGGGGGGKSWRGPMCVFQH